MTALALSTTAVSIPGSFSTDFAALSPEELAAIAGGFRMGDAVRAGNTAAPTGATAGKYVGAGVGAIAGGV
ncbi:MAG TPA: Blp family class II bacteriocin, partial [Kofleriaceae bacterium]|nr:Blp family class II bacteriocin [Kofleriaceae bacterium]